MDIIVSISFLRVRGHSRVESRPQNLPHLRRHVMLHHIQISPFPDPLATQGKAEMTRTWKLNVLIDTITVM